MGWFKNYEIENPPASKVADGGSSDILTDTAPAIRLLATETQQDHIVSLSELVSGRLPYKHEDGRRLFDPVDDTQFEKDGAYFEKVPKNLLSVFITGRLSFLKASRQVLPVMTTGSTPPPQMRNLLEKVHIQNDHGEWHITEVYFKGFQDAQSRREP